MIPALRPVTSTLRRSLACVLIVFTFLGTSGAWHPAGDDPDCATPVGHDHSAHHERMGAARDAQPPQHCAICHWLQGFRTDSVPDTRVVFDDASAGPAFTLTRHPLQIDSRVDVPSRAPPA